MSTVMIKANPTFQKKMSGGMDILVSEMFGDTIQGENFVGYPCLFLRVQECTLNCGWCDTESVWRYGNPYSTEEIFKLWEENDYIEKFRRGHHLVLTGGSPLKQQRQLINLIEQFVSKYNFKPYIEIENECVLIPQQKMIDFVDCWNNSPKLKNSGNSLSKRYKEDVLKKLSSLSNSWFKFVITEESDWDEIQRDYLDTELIRLNQIVIMPEGEDQSALKLSRPMSVKIAVEKNVRWTDRAHVTIWDKKTGV